MVTFLTINELSLQFPLGPAQRLPLVTLGLYNLLDEAKTILLMDLYFDDPRPEWLRNILWGGYPPKAALIYLHRRHLQHTAGGKGFHPLWVRGRTGPEPQEGKQNQKGLSVCTEKSIHARKN